jgi:hypothetical protein
MLARDVTIISEQCTFADAEGRRCSETRCLTVEHIAPFAKVGPTTVENCCLLSASHDALRAQGGEAPLIRPFLPVVARALRFSPPAKL